MGKRIVVVGSINLDLVARAQHIPVPGETISGGSFQTFFGGKGANQAVAAARLGAPVAMIGRVGTDAFGEQLIEGLRAAGVDTGAVAQSPGSSGVALITTDDRGENSIVVVPGANGALTAQELEKHREVLKSAAMFLTQLEIPIETVEFLAECAAEYNVPLMLDPAPGRPLSGSLLARCKWVTPNETEAEILCGPEFSSRDDAEIAQEIQKRGARNVILKQGARGVLIAEEGKTPFRVTGFAVKALDTTAAGDAWNGAFAVALVRGVTVEESAQFANAVAAIAVTRAGAQPSMPTYDEVERFLQSCGTATRLS